MKTIKVKEYKEALVEKAVRIQKLVNENYLYAFSSGNTDVLYTLKFQESILSKFGDEVEVGEITSSLQKLLLSRLPVSSSQSVLEINSISELINNLGWYV